MCHIYTLLRTQDKKDRQTDSRQAGRQTDRQIDRQTGRQKESKKERKKGRKGNLSGPEDDDDDEDGDMVQGGSPGANRQEGQPGEDLSPRPLSHQPPASPSLRKCPQNLSRGKLLQ